MKKNIGLWITGLTSLVVIAFYGTGLWLNIDQLKKNKEEKSKK
jgi:hypothetical protein